MPKLSVKDYVLRTPVLPSAMAEVISDTSNPDKGLRPLHSY